MSSGGVLLTIGGFDPTAAAGVQLDLKVGEHLSAYVVSAVTSLTAQNTTRFLSLLPVSPQLLTDQLDSIFEDFKIEAIKIGMIGNRALAEVVAKFLGKLPDVATVIDPIFISSTGQRLISDEDISSYSELLLPVGTVVTPNLDELAVLTDSDPNLLKRDMQAVAASAKRLLTETGVRAVFVKGGHSHIDPVEDLLYQRGETGDLVTITPFIHPRLYDGKKPLNVRGTGCATATALACFLMKGKKLADACGEAVNFVQNALARAERFGGGMRVLGNLGVLD